MAPEGYEKAALARSAIALEQGALQPLKTTVCNPLGWKGSESFQLRVLQCGLPNHLSQSGPKPNPFLPWDSRLEVCSVGRDHGLILNKYPVQLGHMLLVTRQWQAQTDWLQPRDWQAIWTVDQRTSGLWFFNSGPDAGASQPHRHVQLLPRTPGITVCPREDWFLRQMNKPRSQEPITSELQAATRVGSRDLTIPEQADHLESLYRELSQSLGLGDPAHDIKPAAPYNLLLTRHWMAMVRRKQDGSHGFSINALGFAGYLLTTSKADQSWLEQNGPEELLSDVVMPIP